MGTCSVRRNSNRNRIKIVILVLLLLTGIALGTYIVYALQAEKTPEEPLNRVRTIPKYTHFSIDDATQIFQDIAFHDYESIFENEVLGKLRDFHEEYGLKATLYVFGKLDTYDLADFPDTYKTEFEDNADWLKIGFHSMTEADPKDEGVTTKEFAEGIEKVNQEILDFAGEESLAHVLRLHYWYATDEMVQVLKKEGVEGLLCGNESNSCYNLNKEQAETLLTSRDGIRPGELSYYVTDIRLEKTDDIFKALDAHKRDRLVVVFTHAWCFQENADKLETALGWLAKMGYEYTFLEKETRVKEVADE